MRYIFHDCELDTDTLEFWSRSELRRLEPQVFDLIRYLVEHPHRLVSRQELIDEIWNGRIVSEAAISSRLNAARKALGDDGKRQAVIKTVPRRGVRFVAELHTVPGPSGAPFGRQTGEVLPARDLPAGSRDQVQKVRFCQGTGATRIAFGVSGQGPPLVRVGHWLTHLEHDWRSPIWRPFLDKLGEDFTVVRYDQRGTGLSSREIGDFSLESLVGDLEAVASAAGLRRFVLYGTSQGVPVAIEYAARHPDRVSALVLHGGYYRGRLLRSEAEKEEGEAILALMRHGWAKEGSQFLQAFASIFAPDGTTEQTKSVAELQRVSASKETAVRLRETFDRLDVSHKLTEIETPTLVIHARNDGVHPFQQSLDMAGTLPNAELVVLESRNHVVLEHDPTWKHFFAAIAGFGLSHGTES